MLQFWSPVFYRNVIKGLVLTFLSWGSMLKWGLLDDCVHTVEWSSTIPNYSFSLSLSLGFDLHVFPSWCATLCKVTGTRDHKPTLNQIWNNNFFLFPSWLYVIFIVAIENKLKQATYKSKDGRKDILKECTYVGSLLESLHINKSMKK